MKTTLAITSLLVASAALPASARESIETRQIVVSYADLDLSTTAGAATLDRRLGAAVDAVCGGRPAAIELAWQRSYETCSTQAWAGARAQLARSPAASQLAQSAIRVRR